MVKSKGIEYEIEPLRPSRKWQTWKLAIRSIATFFVSIAIIIFIVLGTQHTMNTEYYVFWDFVSLPICGVAFLWNVAEFVTVGVRKTAGIHPGAHIALDFCLFGALIGGGVVSIFIWLTNREPGIAAASLAILSGLFHFVLFVLSCIEVDRRRKDLIKQLLLAKGGEANNGKLYSDINSKFVAGPAHPATAYLAGLPADAPLTIEHNGIVYYAVPPAAFLHKQLPPGEQPQPQVAGQGPPTYVRDSPEGEAGEMELPAEKV